MSDRPEDILSRLDGLEQIGEVVGALRAIASGRETSAREALTAIRAHARTLSDALVRIAPGAPAPQTSGQGLLLVIGASQGFSGAYPGRIAEAAKSALHAGGRLMVTGQRTLSMLGEPATNVVWSGEMATHLADLTGLASRITDAMVALSARYSGPIRVVVAAAEPGQPVGTRAIFPPEPIPPRSDRNPPLTTLPPGDLVAGLMTETLFAAVAYALTEGLMAENMARVEAMARAQGNLKTKRADLTRDYQQARQEQMTTEMIELAAGGDAAR